MALDGNQTASGKVVYYWDNRSFASFGVGVSKSDGLLDAPKLRQPEAHVWDSYHGETVDLSERYHEPRDIQLKCFVVAGTREAFVAAVRDFAAAVTAPGLHQLRAEVDPDRPLVYMVYTSAEISVDKTWPESDGRTAGTFTLSLREPQPVKRVLRAEVDRSGGRPPAVAVTLTSGKLVDIFWGDGGADYDIAGENVATEHNYTNSGIYYIVICGCIDEVTAMQTNNATIVWNRL